MRGIRFFIFINVLFSSSCGFSWYSWCCANLADGRWWIFMVICLQDRFLSPTNCFFFRLGKKNFVFLGNRTVSYTSFFPTLWFFYVLKPWKYWAKISASKIRQKKILIFQFFQYFLLQTKLIGWRILLGANSFFLYSDSWLRLFMVRKIKIKQKENSGRR